MITITRNLARQVRAVFKRALSGTGRARTRVVSFRSGPDGLRIRAAGSEAAVEYHRQGDLAPEEITVPLGVRVRPSDLQSTGATGIARNAKTI